jgi:anti-sigma factor RsiW
MQAVAAHLCECSACDALCAELAARAARVFEMMEALPEPVTATGFKAARTRPVPSRAIARWLWPGAAVAVAAGLAIASFVMPKPEAAQPVQIVEAPPDTAVPVVSVEQPARAIEAVARPPMARPKRASSVSTNHFVALDDDPFESGVIMRMTLTPGNAQADIVFDPSGRARAIRLVNDKH